MKKITIILLLFASLSLSFLPAGSLPRDVVTLRSNGAYRKMTSVESSASSSSSDVETFLGAGFAIDYDTYFNDYAGAFANIGVTIPVKYTINGIQTQDRDKMDFPVYSQFGFLGRLPFSNTFGLDLRLGFGLVYDKSTTYRFHYYWTTETITVKKVEYQLFGGVGAYMNFDSEGAMAIKVGVNTAYTFATSLLLESGYSKSEIDYKRTGYEIIPYVGLSFGM